MRVFARETERGWALLTTEDGEAITRLPLLGGADPYYQQDGLSARYEHPEGVVFGTFENARAAAEAAGFEFTGTDEREC